MAQKNRKLTFPETRVTDIVGDAALGEPTWAGGKLLPVLLLNAEKLPVLRDLVSAHEDLPPGDVKVTWARKRLSQKEVFLMLEFEWPLVETIFVRFDVGKHGGLVEGILRRHGFYLVPAKPGERFAHKFDDSRILVEVPDTDFFTDWRKIYVPHLEKTFKKRVNGKRVAADLAKEHLKQIQRIWDTWPPKIE